MTSENLQRTSYRDPNTPDDRVRSGPTSLGENERDMDQYYRPLERIHGSSLHGWGVASGLSVTATLNSATLTVQPGVALDSKGQHISLAMNDNAEVGLNPTGFSTGATFKSVTANGVAMPTSGLTGDKYLTIQFYETFDSDSFNASGLFIYWHTPRLRFLDVAGFPNDGSQVVLAKVSFGSGATAGQVTALSQELRQATDLPVGSIHLQRFVTSSPSASVETVDITEAGVIRAYASGGIDVTVPNATDEIHLERDDGTNFAKVSLGAEKIVARQGTGTESVVIDTESGSITASGGVTATNATFSGPVNAGSITASGGVTATNATFSGAISAGSLTASDGVTATNATFSGPVNVSSITASGGVTAGSATVNGPVNVSSITVSGGVTAGSATVNGPLSASSITASGPLSANSITAGSATVDGPLSATSITASGDLSVDGNVGIGTTSPNNQLVIASQASFGGNASNTGSEPVEVQGPGAGVSFQDRTGGATGRWVIYSDRTGGAGTETLRFWSSYDKVAITQAGGVNMADSAIIGGVASIGGGANIGGSVNANTATIYNAGNQHAAYLASDCCAAWFTGDVHIDGTLAKSGGGFQIDHPTDPAEKFLNHSFVESSEMKNIYDGIAVLDANGEAVIELPAWFEPLNHDFRYQLTSLGAPGPNLYIAQEIANHHFSIAGGTPSMRVSWQVTAIRHDAWAKAHPMQVEEEKSAEERGYFLQPELHGASREQRIEFVRHPQSV